IEVPKDTNFSQLSQETRVLHELDGLACVPKILFEDLLSCLKEIHAQGYVHGDVAGYHRFVLDPYEAVIQDYIGLCETIGVIKFGRKMSLPMLADKLDGEMKQFVTFVKDAHSNRWEIVEEEK
ncbi:6383_t:CDS:2, partial [Paraglomus occultum]